MRRAMNAVDTKEYVREEDQSRRHRNLVASGSQRIWLLLAMGAADVLMEEDNWDFSVSIC